MKNKFHPKFSDLDDIFRASPESIYYDTDGRIYGFTEKNALWYNLKQAQEIDDINTLLMWVYLPRKKKGLYIDNSRDSTDKELIDIENKLVFPDANEFIQIINRVDESIKINIEILYYPERQNTKTKITSVVIRSLEDIEFTNDDLEQLYSDNLNPDIQEYAF